MAAVIGETLGLAVGVAVSPLPVAAVILMLFSSRARANSLSFAVGWVVGIGGVVTVVQLVPGLDTGAGEPSATTGWIKLVLGVLLLRAGARGWRTRPGGDEPAEMPGWMSRVEQMRPGASLGLGLLLSALNPKNLLLSLAAGATIASAGLAASATAGTLAVFTLVAASTVLLPTLGYLVAGKRLDPTLADAKEWLVANNAAVMAVLLLVFGVSLVGDGIAILG